MAQRRPLTMQTVTVFQHSKTFVWIRLPGVPNAHVHRRVHGDVHQIIRTWEDTEIALKQWMLADLRRVVNMLETIINSGSVF